ncbi:MAG: hypothetical protein MJH10_15465 [Epibacterium sp.]|nr:hypothetical protein [Epibacterium sp.]NQX74917.1 hypothetical protein [Epibacterium sp.]
MSKQHDNKNRGAVWAGRSNEHESSLFFARFNIEGQDCVLKVVHTGHANDKAPPLKAKLKIGSKEFEVVFWNDHNPNPKSPKYQLVFQDALEAEIAELERIRAWRENQSEQVA